MRVLRTLEAPLQTPIAPRIDKMPADTLLARLSVAADMTELQPETAPIMTQTTGTSAARRGFFHGAGTIAPIG